MLYNQKIKDILTLLTFYAVLYKSANYIFIGEATEIKPTFIDRFWSFNPHWIWIYLSSFITVPLSYYFWFHKKREDFIFSFGLLTFTSFLIFVFYPTYIPRSHYLPDDMSPLYELIFQTLHTADGVTNCLPSLHVSTAFFVAWWSYDIKKIYFPYFLVYAIAVTISTMTVKQHYFYDGLGGFILSLLIVFGWRYFRKREGINPSLEKV
ncbi:MAG: hypothetical protein CME65_16045 [Halobacteriovoraceae bacterium]|nr:hypothetical protein [Halobacteriovoraceae bacterium]|tara:strand:- start:30212 stop:30835 length:624 start_codon:yes stop_codon:yes gene_type:complete